MRMRGDLSLGILCLVAALAARPFAVTASHGESTQRIADALSLQLTGAKVVSVFILSWTGSYHVSDSELKKNASVVVQRKCGSNCSNYMRAVTKHLSNARSVPCQDGQEDVLIETDNGVSLTYSYSGRLIRVDGDCYLNSVGVQRIIQTPEFLFQ